MSFRKSLFVLAVALPLSAAAENEGQLVERYSTFAGSTQNSAALVAGLRDGKEITLTSATETRTFTPPTKKMGYGNVDHALSIAEASLRKEGVTNPTPDQIQTRLSEVLNDRAKGMGWGEVAKARGFNSLGEVKRAESPSNAGAGATGASKPERASRPERPERPGNGKGRL